MAAVAVGIEAVTHDPSLDAGVDAYPLYDVEISIYGGLDHETEALIENARKAMEKLREEYGIEVIITPNIVYWDVVSIAMVPYNLPILSINGKEVSMGRVLSVDEIVNLVLEFLDRRGEKETLPIVGKNDELIEVAACTW